MQGLLDAVSSQLVQSLRMVRFPSYELVQTRLISREPYRSLSSVRVTESQRLLRGNDTKFATCVLLKRAAKLAYMCPGLNQIHILSTLHNRMLHANVNFDILFCS
jgi:hypothetical protein